MGMSMHNNPPSKEEIAEVILVDAKELVAELKEATASVVSARKTVVDASTKLGLNVYSAHEELLRAHDQLCNVIRIAEIKQRSAIEYLEKKSREALQGMMVRALAIGGISAGIGGAIGGVGAAFLLR
jgi:hypothetical protein